MHVDAVADKDLNSMNILKSVVRRFSGRIDFSRSGPDLLYLVLDQLQKNAPARPSQSDPAMRLLQQDFIMSDLVPIAVAIIAVKKTALSSGYLTSQDFEQLCERAVDDMASIHTQASGVMTQMAPRLPGLSITIGHGKDEASTIAGERISSALVEISYDRHLLPADIAQVNLFNLMGEKLKVNRFEAKKLYEGL